MEAMDSSSIRMVRLFSRTRPSRLAKETVPSGSTVYSSFCVTAWPPAVPAAAIAAPVEALGVSAASAVADRREPHRARLSAMAVICFRICNPPFISDMTSLHYGGKFKLRLKTA